MTHAGSDGPEGKRAESGFQELEIVAYLDRFKVVGIAYFGVGHRATSRRASDFIRSFNDTRLTLADATIFDAHSGEVLESSPFVVLNLDKVDFIYARDNAPPAGRDAGGSGGGAGSSGLPA